MLSRSKLLLSQNVYDDVPGLLLSSKSGAGAPTFATVATDGAGSTGVILPRFSATIVNQLWLGIPLPHGYKIASDIDPHVHYMTNDANLGDIVFEFEYVGVNEGGILGNTTVNTLSVAGGSAPVAAPGVALQHQLEDFAEIDGSACEMGCIFPCRFARLGNDAEDTYGGTIWALQVDFHIIKDSVGSGTDEHDNKNIA